MQGSGPECPLEWTLKREDMLPPAVTQQDPTGPKHTIAAFYKPTNPT